MTEVIIEEPEEVPDNQLPADVEDAEPDTGESGRSDELPADAQ